VTSADVRKWESHLVDVMKSKRFRNMEGLGGELPSYIYPYDPSDSLAVADSKKRIKNKLAQEGIEVREVNLYELVIELLRERWDDLIELEPTIGKDDFLSGLVSMLNPTDDLAPAIREKLGAKPYDISFLTGIGEVFPYIRAHNVLNNLQAVAVDRPMVTFFPGRYEQSENMGKSLVLFGMLKSDNYYRAKDIREQDA
jgi:hypothetical protein